MKTVDKNKIYVYSVEQNAIIALVATSFGHYDHQQANGLQKLKRAGNMCNS